MKNAIISLICYLIVGSAYSQISDKNGGISILNKLSEDNDYYVRDGTALCIGSAYPYIIDEKQAMYLIGRLSKDVDETVRSSAYYSLGRISIYKATLTENDNRFREELEKALEFFEKASNEKTYNNPAEFCLPFYRSFHAITSDKKDAEVEVKTYLKQARNAVRLSKSREKLLEVVENLSNALKEAQKTDKMDLDVMKSNLNAFRKYCDRACELLDSTEEVAPGAVNLMRRGLPIIDENIKKILADIEEKSKDFCKDSKQTPFENISRKTYENVKGLGELNSPIEAEMMLNKSISFWRSICDILPEESRVFINELLDKMEVAELYEKAKTNVIILSAVQPQIINLQEKLADKDKLIEYLKDSVTQRLDNINYGVFKIKHNSAEIKLALNQVQIELKKLNLIKTDIDNFGTNLEELGDLQNRNFKELNDGMNYICNIIENELLPKLPENEDKQTIIDKIDELKQSEAETLFNRAAGFSSIIGLILPLLL